MGCAEESNPKFHNEAEKRRSPRSSARKLPRERHSSALFTPRHSKVERDLRARCQNKCVPLWRDASINIGLGYLFSEAHALPRLSSPVLPASSCPNSVWERTCPRNSVSLRQRWRTGRRVETECFVR